MPKIQVNTNKEAPVVEEVKAQEKPKAAKPAEDSSVKKVQEFLVEQGEQGATANAIGKHLGLIKDDMSKIELKSAERGVRVIARKAVDTHENGKRAVRNGRNKVYQII